MKFVKSFDSLIEKITSHILVASVVLMLIFSVLNIVFRWFDRSFLWIEPLVRHLVFLCAFLGGILATGRGTHIGIDIVSKYLEVRNLVSVQHIIKRVIAIVSFIVLLWLSKASYDFMLVELEYGRPEFWGIHSGILVGIIPVGFFIIGIRYLNLLILSCGKES